MFYGREEELEFLNKRYESNKAEFIVLYGRRRVGKTELLRFFCKDKSNLFYVCRECTDLAQISIFSKKILKGSPMSSYIDKFRDWEDAFRFIKDAPIKGKKLVI